MRPEDLDEQLIVDYAFIEVFGSPMRDDEMLSWDGLKFNPVTKKIEKIEEEKSTQGI